MSQVKISQLPSLTAPSRTDLIPLVDASANTTKYIQMMYALTGATRIIAPVGYTGFAHDYTNGVADEVKIQGLLDEINTLNGGELVLVKNTYKVKGTIKLYPNTTLSGQGRGVTIIQADPSWLSGDGITIGSQEQGFASGSTDAPDTYNNIVIKDLEYDANNTTHTTIAMWAATNIKIDDFYGHNGLGNTNGPYGIYFVNCTNLTISNSEIGNISGRDCVQFKGVINGKLINSYIHDNANGFNALDSHASNGTYTRNGQDIKIINNRIDSCNVGISVQEDDSLIEENTILNFKSVGIELQSNPKNVNISHNNIDGNISGNTGQGILINTGNIANNIQIKLNNISNINGSNTSDGIVIIGALGVDVSNNFIRNSGRYAISARANSYSINNNRLVDDQSIPTQQYGVYLDTNVSNTQVIGNYCLNNIVAGIKLNGANASSFITENDLIGGQYGIICSTNTNNNSQIINNYYSNNSITQLSLVSSSLGTNSFYNMIINGSLGLNVIPNSASKLDIGGAMRVGGAVVLTQSSGASSFGALAADHQMGMSVDSSNANTMTIWEKTGSSTAARYFFTHSGNMGLGVTTPTAQLHTKASNGSSFTAPIKFTAGTNLVTPEGGTLEYDGSHLYITTDDGTRHTLV